MDAKPSQVGRRNIIPFTFTRRRRGEAMEEGELKKVVEMNNKGNNK